MPAAPAASNERRGDGAAADFLAGAPPHVADVAEDDGQALDRARRVERHVGSSRDEHGEDGGDHARRALEGDRHPALRADPLGDEPARQAAREAGELAIRDLPTLGTLCTLGDDGRRAGGARRLSEEGVMGQRRLGPGLAVLAGLAAVAPGEELAALGRREERELGERPLRRGERGGEEGRQVVEEARRRRLGEQEGVVGEPQPDAAIAISLAAGIGPLFGDEAELEGLPRQVRRGIGGQDGDPEAREGEPRRRLATEEEHDLERRRAALVARQAQDREEHLERQVLVRGDGRRRLPDLVDERAVTSVEPRAGAEDPGVAEGTDQPLGLRAAALDRRADEEVLLAAGAPEDGGPGSQEGRRERRPAPAAQLAEGRGERRRQHAVDLAGEEPMRRGAVEVGRQSQDGKRRGELAPPGINLAGERIAREVQPLPERMVGVL